MEKIVLFLLFAGILAGYHIYFVEPKIQKIETIPQIFTIDENEISEKILKISIEKKWGEKEIKEAIDVLKQKISNYNGIILDSKIVLNPKNFDITNKLLEE